MNVNVKKTPTLWSTVKQAADHQNGPSTSTTVSSATVEGKDKVGGTDSSSGHSIKIFTDKGGTPQLGTVNQAVLGAFFDPKTHQSTSEIQKNTLAAAAEKGILDATKVDIVIRPNHAEKAESLAQQADIRNSFAMSAKKAESDDLDQEKLEIKPKPNSNSSHDTLEEALEKLMDDEEEKLLAESTAGPHQKEKSEKPKKTTPATPKTKAAATPKRRGKASNFGGSASASGKGNGNKGSLTTRASSPKASAKAQAKPKASSERSSRAKNFAGGRGTGKKWTWDELKWIDCRFHSNREWLSIAVVYGFSFRILVELRPVVTAYTFRKLKYLLFYDCFRLTLF